MRGGWLALAVVVTAVAVSTADHVTATPAYIAPVLIAPESATVRGISTDGNRVLIGRQPSGQSVVVDAATGGLFTAPFAGQTIFARDGKSVLISTTDSHDASDTDGLFDVYQWFPDSNTWLLRTGSGPSGWDLVAAATNLDGSVVLTSAFNAGSLSRDLLLFDPTKVTPLSPLVGDTTAIAGPQLSDDGHRMMYLSGFGSSLSVLDLSTSSVIPLEQFCCLGLVGPAFAISGDGRTVAYAMHTIFPISEPTDSTFPFPPANPVETSRYVVRKIGSFDKRIIGEASLDNPVISLSIDGSRAAFTTDNDHGVTQAVVADMGQSGLRPVSRSVLADANADVTLVLLSGDGGTAAFSSAATNLAPVGAGFHAFRKALPPRITEGLVAVTPARVLDTRPDQLPTVDALYSGIGRNAAHQELALPVAGRGGVPNDAAGVMLNVTVTDPDAAGFATVFPCGQPLPTASNLNFAAGATVANNVFSALGGGSVCLYTNVTADLVVDVNGYAIAGAGFEPVTPSRMLDTRTENAPTVDGRYAGGGRRPAGFVSVFQVAGRGGINSRGGPYIMSVTAVDPERPGFLTVYPCSQARPLASSLNFAAHQTVANTVIVAPGEATQEGTIATDFLPPPPPPIFGNICIFNSAPTDIVVDVNGFIDPRGQYSPALRAPIDSTFVALAPTRLLETRTGQPSTIDGQFSGIGSLAQGTETRLVVVGRADVSPTARWVALNITSTASLDAGFVTVYPCGQARPTASNLNYAVNQTVANNVIAKIGDGGSVCLFNSGRTDLVVDMGGFLSG